MKSVFILSLLSVQVFAVEFSGKDLEKIRSKVRTVATGQSVGVKLSKSNATCGVNDMSQLPGYNCVLFGKNRGDQLVLASVDIETIEASVQTSATGQSVKVPTLRGTTVTCRVNSMAQLPGYSCKN